MEATDLMGVNTVVECAGNQTAFDQAVEIARGGGKILLVGVYEDPLTWQPLPVIGKNLTLIGCLGGNFRAVIELFKEGKVNTKGMITHRFSLDEAATAVVQEAATAVSGEEPTAAPDAEATATEATAATRVADDGDRGS
ncbi:MAG: 2-deoxy-scyllo-inosamine dehydrogenase [Actinobacteria bacterium ADurb.BinA094]|nr:MAG: 2-deoxy-scyllo-inosamine dehydrogenase [Actinobacteria bacterium ADurb.BinA094]